MKKISNKIIPADQIAATLKFMRANNKVVFTNGCFDVLHAGHVLYIEQAASCGDLLVLGLNSDESVRRLKGPQRPINNQHERALVLAGLGFIDYVVIFDQDTPYELIKAVRPDVLVKGGDWKPEQIVGSDIVLANGGQVKSLTFVEGLSTTNTVQKILQVYGGKNA